MTTRAAPRVHASDSGSVYRKRPGRRADVCDNVLHVHYILSLCRLSRWIEKGWRVPSEATCDGNHGRLPCLRMAVAGIRLRRDS
jgi:hypothetical protein